MFKRIELENFRSFTHLDLDLTGKGDSPKAYALIYGENGSGKTDIVESVSFLKDSMRTLLAGAEIPLRGKAVQAPGEQPDADQGLRGQPADCISRYVRDAATIGASSPMAARYTFTVNGRDAVYEMRFDYDGRIVHERLQSVITDRMGRYFEVDRADGGISLRFGAGLITGRRFKADLTELADRHWGEHTFLAILCMGCRDSGEEHVRGMMRPEMIDLMGYLDGVMVNGVQRNAVPVSPWGFNAMEGAMPPGSEALLEAYGEAVDSFFTRMCTDVTRAYYETTPGEKQTLYRLMFSKRISEVDREVPATAESSGTRELLGLLPALLGCARGDVVFVDGLGSGIHEKLVRDLMGEVLPAVKGQLVITTHNTSLIRDAPPQNVYIIEMDALGNKAVESVDAIARTQKGHNNASRYLDGVFGGVPYIGVADLEGIAGRLDGRVGRLRCVRRTRSSSPMGGA